MFVINKEHVVISFIKFFMVIYSPFNLFLVFNLLFSFSSYSSIVCNSFLENNTIFLKNKYFYKS